MKTRETLLPSGLRVVSTRETPTITSRVTWDGSRRVLEEVFHGEVLIRRAADFGNGLTEVRTYYDGNTALGIPCMHFFEDRNGNFEGLCELWDPQGRLRGREIWHHNQLEGEAVHYDESGKVDRVQFYRKSQLVRDIKDEKELRWWKAYS